MREIKIGDLLIAVIGNILEIKSGKTFSPNPSDPLQYGLFRFNKGETQQPHIHKNRGRKAWHKTQEFTFIVSGEIEAEFYSLDKVLVEKIILRENDFAMLYDGGHGFKTLKNNTIYFEVKSGPYINIETDKEKF